MYITSNLPWGFSVLFSGCSLNNTIKQPPFIICRDFRFTEEFLDNDFVCGAIKWFRILESYLSIVPAVYGHHAGHETAKKSQETRRFYWEASAGSVNVSLYISRLWLSALIRYSTVNSVFILALSSLLVKSQPQSLILKLSFVGICQIIIQFARWKWQKHPDWPRSQPGNAHTGQRTPGQKIWQNVNREMWVKKWVEEVSISCKVISEGSEREEESQCLTNSVLMLSTHR